MFWGRILVEFLQDVYALILLVFMLKINNTSTRIDIDFISFRLGIMVNFLLLKLCMFYNGLSVLPSKLKITGCCLIVSSFRSEFKVIGLVFLMLVDTHNSTVIGMILGHV